MSLRNGRKRGPEFPIRRKLTRGFTVIDPDELEKTDKYNNLPYIKTPEWLNRLPELNSANEIVHHERKEVTHEITKEMSSLLCGLSTGTVSKGLSSSSQTLPQIATLDLKTWSRYRRC